MQKHSTKNKQCLWRFIMSYSCIDSKKWSSNMRNQNKTCYDLLSYQSVTNFYFQCPVTLRPSTTMSPSRPLGIRQRANRNSRLCTSSSNDNSNLLQKACNRMQRRVDMRPTPTNYGALALSDVLKFSLITRNLRLGSR